MTKFQRLEAQASWRPGAGAQLREVIVSVGEATLVVSDPKSDAPLAHWSLPAVTRLNPGEMPARFAPAGAPRAQGRHHSENPGGEYVEIDDETMLAAIAELHRAIEARRPHPGRLRGRLMWGAALLMAGFALFWLPGALTRHAAQITPQSERDEIGRAVLADLIRSTGAPCRQPEAQAVLSRIAARSLGEQARLVVLPQRFETAMILPGGLAVVPRDLVSGEDSPDILAGHLVAAEMAAGRASPMLAALEYAGLRNVLSLLTSGTLPAGAMEGYGETLISTPPEPADPSQLAAQFAARQIPLAPYAQSLGLDAAATAELMALDRGGAAEQALIPDRDWVLAQQICAD
ncbi:MAG: hypothetical protein Q4G36_07040 [Paracoccus sp. (in: a-proteobacteria)]|nr:hypothetical protein [Paracoccus sp. (in: a-proteobacteria)]